MTGSRVKTESYFHDSLLLSYSHYVLALLYSQDGIGSNMQLKQLKKKKIIENRNQDVEDVFLV
eukprot:CAMPEP_0205825420 /NCGR_PEP_ID=MMETSP0206-20130828/25116_1 /ASSEMBLY_ACC=CAM_ASM_000279 /TAXON_ID=36767 /ORGANISM="Euplotes focardii, Strain TN1" /LENGTH=62 /DNA_ID=CAMNT_0053124447 /DNA_START=1030 /DNA_END=1218 /DNA_ORIENTATION=-